MCPAGTQEIFGAVAFVPRGAQGSPAGALEGAERGATLGPRNERFTASRYRQAEAALRRCDAVIDRYERLTGELDQEYGLRPTARSNSFSAAFSAKTPTPSGTTRTGDFGGKLPAMAAISESFSVVAPEIAPEPMT
jgi:hypothetical protein